MLLYTSFSAFLGELKLILYQCFLSWHGLFTLEVQLYSIQTNYDLWRGYRRMFQSSRGGSNDPPCPCLWAPMNRSWMWAGGIIIILRYAWSQTSPVTMKT